MEIKKITKQIVFANSSKLEHIDIGNWGVWSGSQLILVTSSKQRAESLVKRSSKF